VDDLGFKSLQGQEIFSSKCPDWFCGSPSLLISGYMSPFSGVKWVGHEADDSPPSSAKVKNEWNYTYMPPWCVQGQLYLYMSYFLAFYDETA
jgi:hypothetical protein